MLAEKGEGAEDAGIQGRTACVREQALAGLKSRLGLGRWENGVAMGAKPRSYLRLSLGYAEANLQDSRLVKLETRWTQKSGATFKGQPEDGIVFRASVAFDAATLL